MFVEQWRLHTLTFHSMLYWLGLSVIFFPSPGPLKSCFPGSIRVTTCPSAVVAMATSVPATLDCAVPSSWWCHTKGCSEVWDSSAVTNYTTTLSHCSWGRLLLRGRFSTSLNDLYSSWATLLGAVWGSASLHVNKFGNLASVEKRGLQVSSQFYFALELQWNAFNVLEFNQPPPSQESSGNIFSWAKHYPWKYMTNPSLYTHHTRTTFPGINPGGWLPLTAVAQKCGMGWKKKKIAIESGPTSFFPRLHELYKD